MGESSKVRIEFTTIRAEKVEFGRNNFIEIARKRAKTEDGLENEFISLTRGYYLPDRKERFKRSISIPDEAGLKKLIAEKIQEL